MIEKKYVEFYANSSGVDFKVAEKDIILTYILKTMKEDGILESLAFKGGTCIRKKYLGAVGRFSEDLDSNSISILADVRKHSQFILVKKVKEDLVSIS